MSDIRKSSFARMASMMVLAASAAAVPAVAQTAPAKAPPADKSAPPAAPRTPAPPAFKPTPKAEPIAFEGTKPTAASIYKKHLESSGGEAAWQSKTSMHSLGTMKFPAAGLEGTMDVKAMMPNLMGVSITLPSIGVTRGGFDGTTGWSSDPMRGQTLLEDKELEDLRRLAQFRRDVDLATNPGTSQVEGQAKFDGRTVWQVKVGDASNTINYYDTTSGLLVGSTLKAVTPMGEIPMVITMSDYKEFEGVKLPVKTTFWMMMQSQDIILNSVEWNTLKAADFALPPEIVALKDAKAAEPPAATPPATTPPAKTPPATPPATTPPATPPAAQKTPAPPAIPPQEAPTLTTKATTEAVPTAADLFKKNIEVTGGLSNWKAKKSLVTRASISIPAVPGANGTLESKVIAPDRVATFTEFSGQAIRAGFDGTTGWRIVPGRGPSILEGKDLAAARRSMNYYTDITLAEKPGQSKTVGLAQFGPDDVWQVQVIDDDGTQYTNLYDKHSGLLRGMIRETKTPRATSVSTTVYDGYKDFGGLKLPTQVTIFNNGMAQSMKVEGYEWDTVTAADCALPPEIAALVEAKKKTPAQGG